MPYQERLTVDGVALHAGGLPGYPESHGCVHLPSKFAEDLFGASHMGMTVVVVNDRTAPADVVHPAALAPVDAATGADEIEARLKAGEPYRWEPDKSPDGPVSLVMSSADSRVIVIRNGVEIGHARIDVRDPGKPLGTHAFMVKAGEGQGESVLVRGAAARNWMSVPMPGYGGPGFRLDGHFSGQRDHFGRRITQLAFQNLHRCNCRMGESISLHKSWRTVRVSRIAGNQP